MIKKDIAPFGALPSYRQINHFRYYAKKAFFHFGVNTFSDMEWGDGTERESLFNPTELDVRKWICEIKEAGFTLAILTVKHHDGFCLWPSKYTEHSVKKSPYKDGLGDVVREFTDACHAEGVAVGIYISPWDRNSPLWGSSEYSVYFNNQLTELLTNYGKIDEVWWDGAGSHETKYDWSMWANTVRTLQPDAVMFGSMGASDYVECRWIGNECGISGEYHYPTITYDAMIDEDAALLNTGVFGGDRFIIAEADTSIRPGWFYHKDQDAFVKTPGQLVDLWFNSVGSSALMLLNFPPDRRGLIWETDYKNALAAYNIVQKALSTNYAKNAVISANSVREGYEPHNMICDDYHSVYAASDDNINPVIDIELEGEKTFDTLILGEYAELGVRINGIRIEAFSEGEWRLVADKKSVGFKKAIYFGKIVSSKIRLTVYGAGAAPVLREIGLYDFESAGFDVNDKGPQPVKNVDISKNSAVRQTYSKDGVTINFGGLYPFNTIIFDGCGISDYELQIFNGSQFKTVKSGHNPSKDEVITLDKTVSDSYQIRIKTEPVCDENINVRVYCK